MNSPFVQSFNILMWVLFSGLLQHALAADVREEERVYKFQALKDKQTAHGNCFPVSAQYVITAAHLIADKAEVSVIVGDKTLKGLVVGLDKQSDIALVYFEDAKFNPIDLHPEEQDVEFRGSARVDSETGPVAGPIKRVTGVTTGGKIVCKCEVGQSGSPVFRNGNFIGMIVSINPEKTEATYISAALISAFINATRIVIELR